MTQKTTRSRAAAVRAAREAKAARDRQRREREQRIEAALADFYEGATAAARVREEAQARAERIIEDAEAKAQRYDAQAGAAVRELRGLDQTNAEIAELCGLNVATVRALANQRERTPGAEHSANGSPPSEPEEAGGEHADKPDGEHAAGSTEGGEGANVPDVRGSEWEAAAG